MGAWGLGVFNNDCALDWLDTLQNSVGLRELANALSAVAESEEYLEVDEGSVGLAAIEIINLLKGNGPNGVPEHIMEWVHGNEHRNVTPLIPLANSALEKIDNPETSEVAGLWLEAGHNWSGMIADIRKRLNR